MGVSHCGSRIEGLGLELGREVLVFLMYLGIGAEEGVLGHIGGEATGGWSTPKRFSHGPDVLRPGAAADAQVVDPDGVRVTREIRDLIAIAGEGVQRFRERTA